MTRYVTGTQRESKNYKERIPAIPYMYGNAEAGITLRDVFLKGATLDIHYMMNYIRQFSYEWNTYNNPELQFLQEVGVHGLGRFHQHLQRSPVRQLQDAEAGTRLRRQIRI